MKQLLFVTILGLTLFSCRRSNEVSIDAIEGKWRMIEVENSAGQTFTRPSSITGNVDITFRHSSTVMGVFNGNTPTNTIMASEFLLAGNRQITISSLGMTKVSETSWGLFFVDNICFSKEYRLYANRLEIKTTDITLTFERI